MALDNINVVHRSSLKQKNRKHNTLGHRTKGQVRSLSCGRVSAKVLTKSARKDLGKQQRRLQSKQIRAHKREEIIFKKRQLGTNSSPPFLVGVIPLSLNVTLRYIIENLIECEGLSSSKFSAQGLLHLCSSRLKQRFSFVFPPVGDLFAILDTLKVCDTLMLVWKVDEVLDDSQHMLLSTIFGQGLPSTIHAVVGDEEYATKNSVSENLESVLKSSLVISEQPPKKANLRTRKLKELQFMISTKFPEHGRLYCLDKVQDVNLMLRQIGAQKQRSIFYRDHRSHIIAERVTFDGKEKEGSSGTLKIQGYIRGQPMNVNRLIHIPSWGDFQIAQIDMLGDPNIMELHRNTQNRIVDEEARLLDVPDLDIQESLDATYEPDSDYEEQTWPTSEEIQESLKEHEERKKRKKVPKGTSEYQAAWFFQSDDEEDLSDADSQKSQEMDACPPDIAPHAPSSEDESEEEYVDQEDNDDKTTLTDAADEYDQKVDYDQEMDDYLAQLKASKDDAEFPDEIDTPMDIPAKLRFQKYRGLQSFRASPWDKNENLPNDYGRIAHFRNFLHTKRRIFKEDQEGASPGWYVVIHLKDVPRHLYKEHVISRSPLVAISMLRYEQKMSLLNVVVRSHSSWHLEPIKSKERLIFHVGFRRFANCPIFSEHSTGDKHKFFRFFQPGSTVVVSMFAPVTFPPCPVSVFKERIDGSQILIGLGSVLSVDPGRIICKRVILSGHPYKVNPKSAVVRYMFFNPEDIQWFKSVELRTKWGKRGHIKESLGTHGHMKCQFNGQLKSQDTVLMNLYKRVFPKWRYEPFITRPPCLFLPSPLDCDSNEVQGDSESESESFEPAKKKKMVRFQT